MEITKESEELEFLEPAKLGAGRFAQLCKIWKQDKNTMPLPVWLAKFDIKYVSLDWKTNGTRQADPMLSFFKELPQRNIYSLSLKADSFCRWLPLPTIWLEKWKNSKAYSLQNLWEEEE